MRIPAKVPMRGFRGLGQTYNTVSTANGDYIVVAGSDGTQTIFDPNGNVVPSIPSGVAPPGFVGPLQGTQSYSGNVSISTAPATSLASLFPGLTGSTSVAGVSVPSWLIPAALVVGAFVLFKGFSK